MKFERYKAQYELLGLSMKDSLTPELLSKSYKKAVRVWHPDFNPTKVVEATRKFQDIQDAFESLSRLIGEEGGELLVDGVKQVHSRDFLKHFGYERLAEMTQDVLIEISMDRAVATLRAEASGTNLGNQAASFVDGMLMRKIRFWASHDPHDAGRSYVVLDDLGHFTPQAAINLLRWATIYEETKTVEKSRTAKIFIFEFKETFEDVDQQDAGISNLIRHYVESNFVTVPGEGYVHNESRNFYFGKAYDGLAKSLAAAVKAVPELEAKLVPHALLASASVAETAHTGALFSAAQALLDEREKDSAVSPNAKALKQAVTAGNKQLETIQNELSTMASRFRLELAELREIVMGEANGAGLPPGGKIQAPRMRKLFVEEKSLSEKLSAADSALRAYNAGAPEALTAIARDALQKAKIYVDILVALSMAKPAETGGMDESEDAPQSPRGILALLR